MPSVLNRIGKGLVTLGSGQSFAQQDQEVATADLITQNARIAKTRADTLEAEPDRAARRQQLTAAAFSDGPDSDQALQQLFVEFPEIGERSFQLLGAIEQRDKERISERVAKIASLPPEKQDAEIIKQLQEAPEGADMTHTKQLLAMPAGSKEREQALRFAQGLGLSVQQRAQQGIQEQQLEQAGERIEQGQEGLDIQREGLDLRERGVELDEQRAAREAEQGPDTSIKTFKDDGFEVTAAIDDAGNIVKEIGRNPISSDKKGPTATQGKAAGFAKRVADSNAIFDELDQVKDETGAIVGTGGLSQFTGISDRITGSRFVPQGFKSKERQSFEQAQRNFINAVLRRESGARIAPDEFDNADLQYFPQPGDGADVLEQKRNNRIAVQAAFEVESGPALQDVASRVAELEGGDGFPQATVEVAGRTLIVGSLVENNAGQRGRVLQDGSIELVND